MSKPLRDDGNTNHDDLFVEKLIADARNYVVPTEEFRAKILEGAKQIQNQKEVTRWLGRTILTTATLFWIGILAFPIAKAIQAQQEANHSYVNNRTLELFDIEKMEVQNATSQAYSEWRSSLQNKFEAD